MHPLPLARYLPPIPEGVATAWLAEKLPLQPENPENHLNLIQALQAGGKLDSALSAAQNSIEYFTAQNRPQDAEKIQNYLQQMLSEKSKNPSR